MQINNLVDFHCHLDLYPDHHSAVLECERERVNTLTVTTTPRAWPRNRELAARTQFVRPALGLHPQLVDQRAKELQLWETYLPQTRYVGEIGLDAGPRFYRSLNLQIEVFTKILVSCNRAGGKILTVHSTRAASVVLDLIEKNLQPNNCRVVLHWFTGNKSEAKRAVDIGCYFSVNADMFKRETLRDIISTLPPDRILTETDGPFCQHNGKPIHPMHVTKAIDLLAQTLGKTPETMKKMVLSNLEILEAI